jgi:hypothetical protein
MISPLIYSKKFAAKLGMKHFMLVFGRSVFILFFKYIKKILLRLRLGIHQFGCRLFFS